MNKGRGRNFLRKADIGKVKPFPPEKTRLHEQHYKSYPQWTGRRAYWS